MTSILRLRRSLLPAMALAAGAAILAGAVVAFACTAGASIRLNQTGGFLPGETVTGSGTLFSTVAGSGPVQIHWNSMQGPVLWSGAPSASGTVQFTFTTPGVPAGYYFVGATQSDATGHLLTTSAARTAFNVVSPPSSSSSPPTSQQLPTAGHASLGQLSGEEPVAGQPSQPNSPALSQGAAATGGLVTSTLQAPSWRHTNEPSFSTAGGTAPGPGFTRTVSGAAPDYTWLAVALAFSVPMVVLLLGLLALKIRRGRRSPLRLPRETMSLLTWAERVVATAASDSASARAGVLDSDVVATDSALAHAGASSSSTTRMAGPASER